MKQFLLKLVGFVLIQAVLLVGLIRFYKGGDLPYFAKINNQHAIAEAATAPRLFICGGSSTPLAFDSQMIQEATGYHVVNMGLNGGLGLGFILNQALDVVHRGDAVILALEHSFFSRAVPREYRLSMLTNVLLVRPSSVKYMAWSDLKGVFDSGLLFLRNVIRSSWRDMIDPGHRQLREIRTTMHGDRAVSPQVVAKLTLPAFSERRRLDNSMDEIDAVIDRLNAFAAESDNRGVQVYFFYGPYPDEYFRHNRLFLEHVHQRLIAHSRIPILGEPIDTLAPAEMFLDTEYHVNPDLRRQTHTALFLERFHKIARTRP